MLKSLIPTKYEHIITKVIIKMNFRYPLNEMVMRKPIIKDLIYKQLPLFFARGCLPVM